MRGCDTLAAKAGPRTQGHSCLQAVSSHLLGCCGVVATWHIPAPLPPFPTSPCHSQISNSQKGSTVSVKESWASKPCPMHQSLLRTSNAQAHSTPLPTIPVEIELQVKNQLQAQPGEESGLSFSWTEDRAQKEEKYLSISCSNLKALTSQNTQNELWAAPCSTSSTASLTQTCPCQGACLERYGSGLSPCLASLGPWQEQTLPRKGPISDPEIGPTQTGQEAPQECWREQRTKLALKVLCVPPRSC